MKGSKSATLSLAQRCKNILTSNWQAHLNTIKADAKGSKEDIYTSKVKYIVKKGRPYVWVPENDMHNVNTVIDERGSLAISSPFPGRLSSLLRSIEKLPTRVALTGEIIPLSDEKVKLAVESVKEIILSEQRLMNGFTYTVSGVLSSSNLITTSRSENLMQLIDGRERYRVYRFNTSSCMYIDGFGRTHEVEMEDLGKHKADPIASFSARLIDGINQSDARRRALVLFCFLHNNANVKDAYVLSVDYLGFDLLGMVPGPITNDGHSDYRWKEFRFTFKEEARDIETFCRQLVEMEEEAVKQVSSYSGLS